MEYERGTYQKLPIKQYAPRELAETAEGRYWRQFKAPISTKQVRDCWIGCVLWNWRR